MNPLHISLADALIDIEAELRLLQLWDEQEPPEEALASVQPFAVDTLSFPQWLQFIFIPRMYFMIDENLELPSNCAIAPMAEQYFAVLNLHSSPLLEHLQRVDSLLSS